MICCIHIDIPHSLQLRGVRTVFRAVCLHHHIRLSMRQQQKRAEQHPNRAPSPIPDDSRSSSLTT